jgi:hypothetical protein
MIRPTERIHFHPPVLVRCRKFKAIRVALAVDVVMEDSKGFFAVVLMQTPTPSINGFRELLRFVAQHTGVLRSDHSLSGPEVEVVEALAGG